MTTYRTAKNQSDLDRCIKKNEGDPLGISLPAIMAERGEDLVGFISSFDFKPDYAPSVVIADSVHVLMKMFGAYDEVLVDSGQFHYVIHISRSNEAIIRVLDNWKYVTPNGGNWRFLYYIREIKHDWIAGRRVKSTE